MPQRTITCPTCSQTHDAEVPEGSPYAVCPNCGGVCELETSAVGPKPKLKLRTAPAPAPHPQPATPPSTPDEAPASATPALATPPPLPPQSGYEAPPFPYAPTPIDVESPAQYWLKFSAKVIVYAFVLTAIHILGQSDFENAFYFRLIDTWLTRILFVGMLYLTVNESFMHFFIVLVGPLCMFFGILDMAALTMDGAFASPKAIMVTVCMALIAIAYPIYLIYVVLRIIESERFKVFFFAMIIAGMLGGGYDLWKVGSEFGKAFNEDPGMAEGLEEIIDYHSGPKK